MIGPSAIGSENGTPTSITSAPAPSSARSRAIDSSTLGWPAVQYGTSARRPDASSAANRRAIASDEVVADPNAIALRIGRLDDRSKESARRILLREIHQRARMEDIPAIVADDPHDRSRHLVRVRIHRMNDRQLEGIE